nr:CHAT domain-containing protein [Chloroflexia bacterium]
GAERLVLVPHGPLHALPLHALWDGEHARYLIETAEVRYAQSASVLGHLHRATGERRRRAAGPALVVGVPDAAAPRIGEEAVRVAAALETGLLLLGNEATCEAVTAAARAAPVIHLACHGVFAPERPLGSGLKLADRWLNVRDVYGLRLRADLVTLSGCETGRATVGDGDELVGLVRGFLAAGAASLLLSLWVVDDASTADLMESFYASYKQGASAAAALRHAQLALLARQPHPAFWAPFVLGGLA